MRPFTEWKPRQIRVTGDVPVRGTGFHEFVEYASIPEHLRHRVEWHGLGCWMWCGEPVSMAESSNVRNWDADGREVAS